jgi:hypothetical protein
MLGSLFLAYMLLMQEDHLASCLINVKTSLFMAYSLPFLLPLSFRGWPSPDRGEGAHPPLTMHVHGSGRLASSGILLMPLSCTDLLVVPICHSNLVLPRPAASPSCRHLSSTLLLLPAATSQMLPRLQLTAALPVSGRLQSTSFP